VPLVSVLIPTYNGEPWLGAALDSALQQTHAELEILIGDDCSTDGTRALAEAYAARDPRVRLLPPAAGNVGAPANQVRLHREAHGAFVKPLLQDDLLAPDCVATLLAPLLADERVVLATSKRGLIDGAGARLPDQAWTAALLPDDAILDGTSLGNAMLGGTTNLVGEVTTALYRAGVVAPQELWLVDGREYRANGDIALWLKLLAGRTAFYTPRELSWFRQHAGQSSQSPAVIAGGCAEWARIGLAARGLGYLATPEQELPALVRAAQVAGSGLQAAAADPALLDELTAALRPLLERAGRLQAPQPAAPAPAAR
jgi:glycosyltransferase involved in cell wall biosynthesis